MAKCAIKVCRNYTGRVKCSKKVTYHRLPTDPVIRSRWIEIIRKSRGEDLWQPAKTTVICSDHFRLKDLYFISNQGPQRLKREAIPSKAVFLASLETDDEDDETIETIEDEQKTNDSETNTLDNEAIFFISLETDDERAECDEIFEYEKETCVTNYLDDTKCSGSNEEDDSLDFMKDDNASFYTETSENLPINNIASSVSFIPCHEAGKTIECEAKKETESDIIEDYSDLDSVYDTPIESKLRRDLRRRIRLQNKHTLKIQSLKRANLRLTKKVASLKGIITKLKKEINGLRHT